MPRVTIINADVLDGLRQLPDESVDCIVTSPPYWGLRDYGVDGQIGLEPTLDEYLDKLLRVTAELKRVLKRTGVMFWVHGDCYRDKCMMLQNYRLLFRLVNEQGWILRNIIIWGKPNAMPSSVTDRFANAYEPIFMLVKERCYWFDLDAVREPHAYPLTPEQMEKKFALRNGKYSNGQRRTAIHTGTAWSGSNPLGKNPGDVWTIPTQPFPEAHYATFPEALVERIIKAACPQQICKRCGTPRKRTSKIVGYSQHGGPRKRADAPGAEVSPSSVFRTGKIAVKKHIGWTDCGCGAGWRSGLVLDPFLGSGTTAVVAAKLQRDCIGIELNKEYVDMAVRRLKSEIPLFLELEVVHAT